MGGKRQFDKALYSAVMLLMAFGLVMVYSTTFALSPAASPLANLVFVRHLLAAVVGLALCGALMFLDYRVLRSPLVVYGLAGATLVLLALALSSPAIGGVRRWLLVGPLSFQPSELAKVVVVVLIAAGCDRRMGAGGEARRGLLPRAGLAIAALAVGLIVLQPDLGAAVVIVATAGLLLVLAGVPWRFFLAVASTLVPLLFIAVLGEPYRRARMMAFLDPEADPLGYGFQPLQSLIAVGSGGVVGQGLGRGVQKLHFLPHPHSDVLFASVAEELGLIGALGLLALYGLLLWRGLRAGRRAPDLFGRLLAGGLTVLIGVQAFSHVGAVLALFPGPGPSLPLMSAGGSSLVVTLAACGVILNVSSHR